MYVSHIHKRFKDKDKVYMPPGTSKVRMVIYRMIRTTDVGFPGGAVVKNPPANAGDTGSRPGPGRSHMPRSN